MWRMLQQPEPEDFILATGETHPVREFVEKAFAVVGTSIRYVYSFNTEKLRTAMTDIADDIILRWEGKGEEEIGIDTKTDKVIVKVDPRYFRPAEVECVYPFVPYLYPALCSISFILPPPQSSSRRSY